MTAETKRLLQSGMDIFYLMRRKKKRCESIYRGVPFLLCLFVFFFNPSKIINIIVEKVAFV